MQTDTVENIFGRAWSLLTKNPVIILPGLIVGVVVGIVQGMMVPRYGPVDPTTGAGAAIAGGLSAVAAGGITLAIAALAFLITQTYTTGMAGAAWQTGRTTLADGSASFREDAGRLLAAVLLIGLVEIVVTVLTFGIGWFVVLFFAIYAVPAVVLDNFSAVPAFRLSATIATRRFLSTLIIIVMLVVIEIVVAMFAIPLAFIPFLGPILLAIISQAVTTYATLVIVGEYLNTRRAPDIMPGPLA